MVVVIACLCLSAGEGLRLRPFPVLGLVDTEATKAQRHVDGSIDASSDLSFAASTNQQRHILTNGYGPVIAPTRLLSRGEQQVIEYDYGSPSSHSNRSLIAHLLRLPVTGKAVGIVYLHLILRIPSRAPPVIS